MFTTHQRVARSPLSTTPWTDGKNVGDVNRHVPGKGKAVAFVDGPSLPPLGGLNEYGGNAAAEGGEMDDWRRFKEAGRVRSVSFIKSSSSKNMITYDSDDNGDFGY